MVAALVDLFFFLDKALVRPLDDEFFEVAVEERADERECSLQRMDWAIVVAQAAMRSSRV